MEEGRSWVPLPASSWPGGAGVGKAAQQAMRAIRDSESLERAASLERALGREELLLPGRLQKPRGLIPLGP